MGKAILMMLKNMLARVVRLSLDIALVSRIRNRIRFPSIGVHPNTVMDIQGRFSYLRGNIGIGSTINVPAGAALELGADCYIGRYVELGPAPRIAIGDRTSLQDRCIVLGNVVIGKYCLFAPNVYLSSGRHQYDTQPWDLIKDQDNLADAMPLEQSTIAIEDDCWIGINVVVMRGVTVGKGAVIAANSVVTKNVPPYAVYGGTPARFLKSRLDFQPPASIAYDKPKDQPYFYSGVLVSSDERKNSAVHGGYLTDRTFVLSLDCANANYVCLEVSVVNATAGALACGGMTIQFSGLNQQIRFDLDGVARSTNRINFKVSDMNSVLILHKAWVA
jgi:acetyltransferase-like isoleucine patch superfamily enzyme